MPQNPLILTASTANLKRLAMIRLLLIIGFLLSLAYVRLVTEADFFHPAHLTILAVFALVNILTYWRVQQRWPVTDLEYFGQLLIDVVGLTIVLYFSGGAANPFVSYFLVPITISAALLPWRYTWVISGLSLAAYSLMLFYYQPFPAVQPHHGSHAHHGGTSINAHILGMWLTFALSTVLITYFVVKMANALRQQQQQQAVDREDELRDEQILAVATLAAGTAHELGTPLSTMLVLLDELLDSHANDQTLHTDLQLLKNQVQACKRILTGLVSTAEIHSHHEQQRVAVKDYLYGLIDRWQLMRPQAAITIHCNEQLQQQTLLVDPTLEQAICNLLNNAADANSEIQPDTAIELQIDCDDQAVNLQVRDHGPGIPMAVADRLGKPFLSTKGKGLGLGLFLSHATIDRYGGRITLYNHPEGGAVAELVLPLVSGDSTQHE